METTPELTKLLSLENSIIIPKKTFDWVSIIWIFVFLILIGVMIFYPMPAPKITPYQEKILGFEERKLKLEEENLKFNSSYLVNQHQLLAKGIDRLEKYLKIEDDSNESESEEIQPRKRKSQKKKSSK